LRCFQVGFPGAQGCERAAFGGVVHQRRARCELEWICRLGVW
jgi:hypothetical protein